VARRLNGQAGEKSHSRAEDSAKRYVGRIFRRQ